MDAYFDLKRFDDLKNLKPKPESKEYQRKIVKLISKSFEIERKGKVYCVIDSKWFNQWKKYVEYDQHPNEIIPLEIVRKRELLEFLEIIESDDEEENEGEDNEEKNVDPDHPGKIDNVEIIDDPSGFLECLGLDFSKAYVSPIETLELKKELKRGVDFEVIPSEVWEHLLFWYGGYHKGFGPCIPRYGFEDSEIDLYPLMIRCSMYRSITSYFWFSGGAEEFTKFRFSRYLSLKEILSILKWKYQVHDLYHPFQRLWLSYLESPLNVCYSSFDDKITPGFKFKEDLLPLFKTGKYQLTVEIRRLNKRFDLKNNLDRETPYLFVKDFERFDNFNNNKCAGKLEEGEDIGTTRILGSKYYFGSLFHCLSKTKCLLKHFTRNQEFLEEMKEFFENPPPRIEQNVERYYNPFGNAGEIRKDLDKVFGDAMMKMWSVKCRFLSINGIKHSIGREYGKYGDAYNMHSPINLYDDFLKLLEKTMDRGRKNFGLNLIEKNFNFMIHHRLVSSSSSKENKVSSGNDNIPEILRYLPVVYNKPLTVEPIQIHPEYNLEEMIKDKISLMNIDIESLPNVLVIGEESYRDSFLIIQQTPPIPKQIEKVITPLTLKPKIFGEKHRKTAQFYYELYGVIYHKANYGTGYHVCRVRVPNVDKTYLYPEEKEKNYQWYEFDDSEIYELDFIDMESLYFSSEWVYSSGRKLRAVPMMWFYEKKRDWDWDDPDLFEGRISYLKDQCSQDSKIGCNMKLSIKIDENENEDIFVPFVFIFIG